MSWMNRIGGAALALLAFGTLAVTGCGPKDSTSRPASTKDSQQAQNQSGKTDDKTNKEGSKKEEAHGWWCQEHGVPEKICSLCNDEHAAKLKKEGDWCKLHDRAKSQCFKCDPSLYERVFEPMYVTKYGNKPPRPPEQEFKK